MQGSKDIIRVLKRLGFYEVRRKGAHICFKHQDGRFTLVPSHGGEDIGKTKKIDLTSFSFSPQKSIRTQKHSALLCSFS
ncbi:type II toxin-antitoxin system HicA family toxin [Patescibacteria group bacterium]|nr:type II toxin-antitoxin system HicA family toxin [Patescibacteria group bacterium]